MHFTINLRLLSPGSYDAPLSCAARGEVISIPDSGLGGLLSVFLAQFLWLWVPRAPWLDELSDASGFLMHAHSSIYLSSGVKCVAGRMGSSVVHAILVTNARVRDRPTSQSMRSSGWHRLHATGRALWSFSFQA
jgi:hypothetical protein